MPFGFGGSRTKSESVGSSRAFDVSASGSVSGGLSASQSTSRQAIAFEDVFARLFGGAEGAAGGLDPSLLTTAANTLFSGGIGFLDSLQGGPGSDFLAERVSGASPVLGEQIAALGEDVGQFFNEQVLPGIGRDAIAAGGFGGGRQGVAEGIAAGEAGRAFSRGATALRGADIAARDQAAATLGAQRIQGAQTGLQSLGQLAGIAEFGFGAGLAPFERLAAILGGPTVLTESQSTATAEDFARAFSQAFGASRSDTRSSSSGRSFSLGF